MKMQTNLSNKKSPGGQDRGFSPNTSFERTYDADFNRIDLYRQIGGEPMISTAVSPAIAKGMATAQERHQTKREELSTLYYEALGAIKAKKQWASGEILTIHKGLLRGLPTEVSLKNERGTVYLSLFMEGQGGRMDKRFYSQPLAIGLLKPDTGWVVCGVDKYLSWNRQVRKAMESA